MKKLALIFHGRFPSDKAAALFAAKSAEAFALQGLDVTVLVPRRNGLVAEDPFDFYSVKKNFKIKYLPIIDLFGFKNINLIAFWVSFITFSISSYLYIRKGFNKNDICYSNETLPLFLLSLTHPNCFYEMHDFPESKKFFFGEFIHRIKWILIHNNWKTERAISDFGLKPNNIITIPNAVELERFDIDVSTTDARKKLELPLDKKIVVYTGHLYSWKGADTLASVASLLPDILFIFVGGTTEDVSLFNNKFKGSNLLFKGFRPHEEIPLWQKAADVLVIPNTAKEDISKYYTSPMKLFEYMASGTPIVASKIPSIEEIVTDDDVFFAEPDNPNSFATIIQHVLNHTDSALEKAVHARAKVEQFTWKVRAQKIIRFINL